MKTNLKRLLAVALIAAMSATAFVSCGNSGSSGSEASSGEASSSAEASEETGSSSGVPLVVAYDTFNQKFNHSVRHGRSDYLYGESVRFRPYRRCRLQRH